MNDIRLYISFFTNILILLEIRTGSMPDLLIRKFLMKRVLNVSENMKKTRENRAGQVGSTELDL